MRTVALADSAHNRAASDDVDREELEIRAAFASLSRDLSASRSSCAAVRELVGPVLAEQ